MIWHSYGWKQDLLKIATKLSKRIHQKRWTKRSYFLLEKEIFFAFYSIRKLIECNKLSDYLVEEKKVLLQFFKHKRLPMRVSMLYPEVAIDEIYDFQNPSTELVNLKDLSNQFIHSYIFMPCFGDSGELDGIIFSSDYKRKHLIYKLLINDLVKLLNIIGTDCICSKLMFFNESGDRDFVNVSKGNLDASLNKLNKLSKKYKNAQEYYDLITDKNGGGN